MGPFHVFLVLDVYDILFIGIRSDSHSMFHSYFHIKVPPLSRKSSGHLTIMTRIRVVLHRNVTTRTQEPLTNVLKLRVEVVNTELKE